MPIELQQLAMTPVLRALLPSTAALGPTVGQQAVVTHDTAFQIHVEVEKRVDKLYNNVLDW
jgi:hypothetical protein